MLKMLDLFSGIGGFSLAASWTGQIETVAFCEIEPYCQKVLKKHWPDVPIHDDIRTLRGEDVGSVDIVCGGFPCQPFSVAGKRRGKEDDRYLWPEMFRVIQETKPTWVIGENVANFVNMALEDCVLDLEGEGYEVQPFIIPACAIGAPHRRDRVWIVAWNSTGNRNTKVRTIREGENAIPFGICQDVADTDVCNPASQGFQDRANHWWAVEPDVGRVANGIPNRVDRIKGLGNAVVPYIPYQIFKLIVQIEQTS